jgi:N-acetylmuramoyl-L-alanine amidase
MRIAMSSGHGKYIRGASGYPVPPQLDEVDEARRVVNRAAELLNSIDGVSCVTFHDNTSHDQSTNLATITNWHNAQTRDYDVSVHFNAFDGSAHGCEVLYVTQQSLASQLSAAISEAGDFTNRGAKYRSDLYVLNNTEMPAVLLETCFCDNTGDSNNYNAAFEDICTVIAETMSGQQVPETPGEQPPVEPPVEPPTEDNRVDIVGRTEGDVAVIINGTLINGNERCRNVVRMRVKMTGDVIVSLNGEEFHNKPDEPAEPPAETGEPDEIPGNQKDITATVFGGGDDPNYSAYPPYDSAGNGRYLNDTDFYVALPFKLQGERPKVRVWNVSNELSHEATIEDVGPWCTTDDYFNKGTRPVAETCNHNGTPLPSDSGPNAGKVPSNDAGIDLSPALADAIGIDGKGKVDWDFVEAPQA